MCAVIGVFVFVEVAVNLLSGLARRQVCGPGQMRWVYVRRADAEWTFRVASGKGAMHAMHTVKEM